MKRKEGLADLPSAAYEDRREYGEPWLARGSESMRLSISGLTMSGRGDYSRDCHRFLEYATNGRACRRRA